MQSNDVTLIQQILNGDQNAFTALVKGIKADTRVCLAEVRGLPSRRRDYAGHLS